MMKQEFESLAGYEVSIDDYNKIIEPMYMATNLTKEEFVKTINKKRFALKPLKSIIKEMKQIAKEIEEMCTHTYTYDLEAQIRSLASEYAEKLEARRRAKAEAQAKAFAEEEAQREAERKAKEEAERIERERQEAEEKARKAISKHVGEIGDKVDLDVVLEKRAWFDVPSFRGFGTDTMYIYTFRDENGNALIWKTSKGLVHESGTKVHLTGQIKAHDEYMEEKQTVLTRCKVKAGE